MNMQQMIERLDALGYERYQIYGDFSGCTCSLWMPNAFTADVRTEKVKTPDEALLKALTMADPQWVEQWKVRQ